MLRPYVFTIALEGLLPRYRPAGRPTPIVWEDHVYAHRLASDLGRLTRRLARHHAPPTGPAAVFAQDPPAATLTSGLHTAWAAALATRRG